MVGKRRASQKAGIPNGWASRLRILFCICIMLRFPLGQAGSQGCAGYLLPGLLGCKSSSVIWDN